MNVEIVTVKKVSEAHGAICAECKLAFNVTNNPYWHWNKSAGMHRQGTGHKVTLYAIA